MKTHYYKAHALNEQGASIDLGYADSMRQIVGHARSTLGKGWSVRITKLHTDEQGQVIDTEEVKRFTIRK